MNRKIILITVTALIVTAVFALSAYGLTQLYYYNNPEVEIHITKLKSTEIDRVTISYNERSRFGMNPAKEIAIFECAGRLRQVYEKLEIGMDEPRYLKAEVSKQPEAATIRLNGYGTKDGMKQEIEEVIILNVTVTDVSLD